MNRSILWACACFVMAQGVACAATPGERALAALHKMTWAQKFALLDGKFAVSVAGIYAPPAGAVGSAGFVPAPENLGVPDLQETDAGLGIAAAYSRIFDFTTGQVSNGPPQRGANAGAVALPSILGLAASFNPDLAYQSGVMIGHEAHIQGFDVMLAGSLDLVREPRCGRIAIYPGEDPLLAGSIGGAQIAGIQSQHVVSTLKHFALNAQETGRMQLNALIGEASFRQADLLAFELGLERGRPGAVMCAYNQVNGAYSCGNKFLLDTVLKGDWGFKGWVMSDWGAVHKLDYLLAGLDQESGDLTDLAENGSAFFSHLQQAVAHHHISEAAVNGAVLRVLTGLYAAGAVDDPPVIAPLDVAADTAVAEAAAEQTLVLLRNEGGVLPIGRFMKHIAVIGGNAANGVLEAGGSEQIWPVGGPAEPVDRLQTGVHPIVWYPNAPLAALQQAAFGRQVTYADGSDLSAAVAAAKAADVVVVFADQPMAEGVDAANLSLPPDAATGVDQDALIAAVAAANPRTVVVLETGGPVLMPWLQQVAAVVAAWNPGAGGATAIARLLLGEVDPSARLPVTFPASEAQLPRPVLDGLTAGGKPFAVNYEIEGASVGYKWFAKTAQTPLFPFGFGLSYTHFDYDHLAVNGGRTVRIAVTVTNKGARPGYAVPQAYVTFPQGVTADPFRLVGFQKLYLLPGQSKRVGMLVDPRLLANYSVARHGFVVPPGEVTVGVGESSAVLQLSGVARLDGSVLPP